MLVLYDKLLFSPVRLGFLIFWFYLCMYMVQRFEFSPLISTKYRPIINVLILLAGPLVLFVLIIAHAAETMQRKGISFAQAIAETFGKAIKMVRTQNFFGSRGQSSIMLLDSSGKSLSEVYGRQQDDEKDRARLRDTENIIANAIEELASDILIDPTSNTNYDVRLRIDGLLRIVKQMEFLPASAVVNSIKAISGMDISEKRRPQDGAFIAKTNDGTVSFRVASAGVLHGEKLSIRVLNQAIAPLSLKEIGVSDKMQDIIFGTISRQSGMVIICGPTGSGKSTSLHAMLREIDFYTRNVITIEDPIEYILPQASQIEINEKADITFAKTLRSVLRQDPDVISIGEIRDDETAQIAVQASQTGHLVFATLHSGSNYAALVRLIDLGVKPLLLSTTLSLVISQRLVRKLCENCKRPATLSESQIMQFKSKKIKTDTIMEARGCEECGKTGYRGRMGIFDVMQLEDDIRAQLADDKMSLSALKDKGDKYIRSGLKKQGLKLVLAGITTMQEVKRVTSNLG